MKLFVWLLEIDTWNHGLAVAMAVDVQDAVKLLIRRGIPEHYFTDDGGIMMESSVVYPIVHENAAAAFVFGGAGQQ